MAYMLEHDVETAIRAAWSAETFDGDGQWDANNPSAGHCDVTSLVIRERLGGDLCMAQVFRDGELSEHHYWNRLPDGTEVDLTREQFDGKETFGPVTVMTPDFFANAGPMRAGLVRRLALFRAGVNAHVE